jgi:cation-transporting P-type ATPase E
VRENIFMPVNTMLFALGLARLTPGTGLRCPHLLRVVLFNVLVSLVQGLRAKRTLDRTPLLTRLQATVM